MKILLICENYYPHYGGAEILFKNLAEGLSRRGHEISVVTSYLKGTEKKEQLNNVDICRTVSFGSRYLFTFTSLLKAIKLARKHDLIQATTFNAAFPAWLAGKITGKPVVLTVHEVWVGKWREITGFSRTKSAVHEFLERMIYWLPFDNYVCVSQATRKDLLKRGIKEENIRVAYNGIDYSFWDPAKVKSEELKELKKKWGIQDKYVYFSWGRAGASKGFEYVIKAMTLVAEKKPDSVLLLMLSLSPQYAQKRRELLDLVGRIDTKNVIKVIPSLPYHELRTLLAAADCVVIPSVAEGFGFSAAEAAAMGKMVIASNAGSLPEIVSGKHHFFESKNVPDLAEKMSKMLQQHFKETEQKRFGWDTCVEGYLTEYTRILEKK